MTNVQETSWHREWPMYWSENWKAPIRKITFTMKIKSEKGEGCGKEMHVM